MKITEVRITPYEAKSLRAFASITIEDCFVVDGLKVLEGDDGLFVVMPSKQTREGKFINTAYPIKKEIRDLIKTEVLNAYEAHVEQVEE